MRGSSVLQGILALTTLLLLAAAGIRHGLLQAPGWAEGDAWLWVPGPVAAALQQQPALPQPAGDAGPGAQVLRATLELPDHTVMEVGEDISLEELLQKLLEVQTGGQLPSGVEIVSVQRISIQRPSPLHAALGAAARVLHRLSACWRGAPSADPPVSQDSGSSTVGDPFDSPAGADTGSDGGSSTLPIASDAQAVLPGSAQPAAAKGSAGSAGAALAAHADAVPAGAALAGPGAEPADFVPAAGAADSEDLYDFGTIPDEQRLPMTAFDEDYMDDPDDLHLPAAHPHLPARALKQQAGPAQVAPAEEGDEEELEWQLLKMFGPRLPTLQQVQRAEEGEAEEDEGNDEDEDSQPLLVRVAVVVRDQATGQWQRQAGDSSIPAALLDRLALAAATGAAQPGSGPLGRKGEAAEGGSGSWEAALPGGGSVRVRVQDATWVEDGGEAAAPVGAQEAQEQRRQAMQQEQQQWAARSAVLLAAVDAVFVAALVVAIVCTLLLALDIRRHGWRHGCLGLGPHDQQQPQQQRRLPRQLSWRCCSPGSQDGEEGQQQLLRAPLLVVAAEEADAAVAGKV